MTGGNRRAKFLLVAVMVLFALPVVLAFGLHSFAPDWRPWETSNRGTLITPSRDVTLSQLNATDGQSLDSLNGKWILVVIGTGCDDHCVALLHLVKQVQISLGREATRVVRLYVGNREQTLPSVVALTEDNPGLRFASAAPGWFQQFSVDGNQPIDAGHVYIVDPRGYLMMEYSRQLEASDIRKDLKRLLKASKGG